jgi:hypothetical protein
MVAQELNTIAVVASKARPKNNFLIFVLKSLGKELIKESPKDVGG